MRNKYFIIILIFFSLILHVTITNSFTMASDIEAPNERRKSGKINYAHFFDSKSHWCETMVINCSDFRFAKASQELVNNILGYKGDYDYFAIPGTVSNMLNSKTRELVLNTFGISVRLHHVKRIVIIGHEDCMGYGGTKSFDNPTEEKETIIKDLRKARRLLRLRFRHLKVYLFYGKVDYNDDNRVYTFEQIF